MMNYDAFCDECFTFVPMNHALERMPCPRCGNTFYEIIDYEKRMPSGGLPFFAQRYANMDSYFDALQQMESIKVTNITDEDYRLFIEAGERCLAVFESAINESIEQDRRAGYDPVLPEVYPFVTRLPDMYMRRGHWREAVTAYKKCSASCFLHEFDFDALIEEAAENKRCVAAIASILENGEHSQNKIKKQLKEQPRRAINWALGYYHGFSRVKEGSDYTINVITFNCNI